MASFLIFFTLASIQYLTLTAAKCTEFLGTTGHFEAAAIVNQTVSPGVVCTDHNAVSNVIHCQSANTSTCPLSTGESAKSFVVGTINLTGPSYPDPYYFKGDDSTIEDLFALLPPVSNSTAHIQTYFSGSLCSEISYCVKPGESGALELTPSMTCVEGRLTCDDDGPIADNTLARFCGGVPDPSLKDLNGNECGPGGLVSFVPLPADQASNITTNPADSVSSAGRLGTEMCSYFAAFAAIALVAMTST